MGLRVTFEDLPPPFESFEGTEMWVMEPEVICENSGQAADPWCNGGICDSPNPGQSCVTDSDCCTDVSSPLRKWFWGATLDCNPSSYTQWAGVCDDSVCSGGLEDGVACNDDSDCAPVVHVYHEALVPNGTYVIDAITEQCDPLDDASFSRPFILTTTWGDVCGPGPGGACTTPPDGVADVTNDVLGVLGKFTNTLALEKAIADIGPAAPDRAVDVASNVLLALEAFQGHPYPFTSQNPCP